MRPAPAAFLPCFFLAIAPLGAAVDRGRAAAQQEVRKGPLTISADETVSREMGKKIDAQGNVRVRYEMDSGDFLESFSDFASYDGKEAVGVLWGSPRALWMRADPGQAPVQLVADRIAMRIKDEELIAQGGVTVAQTSSTLTADQITFLNRKKQLIAQGERPVFTILQERHRTRISSEEIQAWTEKREIQFLRKVRGEVHLLPSPQ